MLKTVNFDYDLPGELIAQHPLEQRDASRLLILRRSDGTIVHRRFTDLVEYLAPGDVLVVNNSRVIPARLTGHKHDTLGKVEILLLEKLDESVWRVLVGGRNVLTGLEIVIEDKEGNATEVIAEVVAEEQGAIRQIRFNNPVESWLAQVGHMPLPPYIHRELHDPERYQTIYSRLEGSAAAPTAGLHFTPELMLKLREKGVIIEYTTLHVGLDTFKPVDVADVKDHQIHSEWSRLTPESARRINEAKLAGGRVFAVGTTTVRVLETAALRSASVSGSLSSISEEDATHNEAGYCAWRPVIAFEGNTDLFIYPGYRFRIVDAMVTNFHLPKSSLLMLVSAFAGREKILSSYREAISEGYRFYSFGDAMLIQ